MQLQSIGTQTCINMAEVCTWHPSSHAYKEGLRETIFYDDCQDGNYTRSGAETVGFYPKVLTTLGMEVIYVYFGY